MKLSGKWEMIQKNPYGFETVWKMGNDLEKSGQLVRFFCYTRKKIPGSNATLLPRFWHLWLLRLARIVDGLAWAILESSIDG